MVKTAKFRNLPHFGEVWRFFSAIFRKVSRFGDFYRNLPQRRCSRRNGAKPAAKAAKPVLNRFKPVFSLFFICGSLRNFAAAKPAILRKIAEFCDIYRNLPHFGEVWRFFFRHFRKSSNLGGFYRNLPHFGEVWRFFSAIFRKVSRFGDFYRNLPQRRCSRRNGAKPAAKAAKPVLNRFKPVFSLFFICGSLRNFAAAKPAILRKIAEFCDIYRNLPHFGEVWRFFFRHFRKSSNLGGFYRNLPHFGEVWRFFYRNLPQFGEVWRRFPQFSALRNFAVFGRFLRLRADFCDFVTQNPPLFHA